ncbi:MAG: hypothetical protein ACRELE_03620 [Gemmatimonadales bacterium]
MDILDRLSGIAIVKERVLETSRNVDRAIAWLLDHEKRILHLESRTDGVSAPPRPPLLRKPQNVNQNAGRRQSKCPPDFGVDLLAIRRRSA